MNDTGNKLVWRGIPGLDPNTYTERDGGTNGRMAGLLASAAAVAARTILLVFRSQKRESKRNFRLLYLRFRTTRWLWYRWFRKKLHFSLPGLFLVPPLRRSPRRSTVLSCSCRHTVVQESAKKGIGFIEAFTLIGKEEGIKGYWKRNLPQVMRVIPYSAAQLFAYETYKKLFSGKDGELSVIGRLAAGACAGMTSTLVTCPLDVLRLRLAVEPCYKTMTEVSLNMIREEGFASIFNGLGPSLIGIAPYIAVNFIVFDLVKKALPDKYQKRTEISLATALVSATIATVMCYPLDTVRRQMQMKGSPFKTIFDAFPGIVARDGLSGLYRGFLPNALKTLPNSSIKLTFETAKV